MFRVNIRVLASLFCIIFSCALTVAYLSITDDSKMNTQIIASTATKAQKASSKMPDIVEVEEVNVEENTNTTSDTDTNDTNSNNEILPEEQVIVPETVYEGMTLDELASKLDRSLKNELHGKGYLYASYSLEKGVDPYLAAAISLEETGCNWNCSTLLKSCNNVGGMKGSGCGSYGAFNTLDEGIKAFIDNISRNYVAYGLTTADLMNPKYAENPAWSTNVNNYINRIRNN